MSDDTLERVERACVAAGLVSWRNIVAAAHDGILFNLDFAERRPLDFVKEFAVLLRSSGLDLAADNALELYLGAPTALQRLNDAKPRVSAHPLGRLGEVRDSEAAGIALSAARRSAGVTYEHRATPRPLCGVSVLVLDDDDVSRKVLSGMLRRAGCQVQVAAEAEAAFALLRSAPVDLVVLDIMLGGALNGFDFCRAMRSNEACRQIPAVFVTGYPESHPHTDAQDVHASAYFQKPVKAARLCAAVRQLTAKEQASEEH